MRKVNSAWTQGLKGEAKSTVESVVLGDTILLDRLQEILYNMQVIREDTVLGDYDSSSWSHKQAHLNGERAIIRKLIAILEVTDRDDHPSI